MANQYLLEICVETVEAAVAAARSGADRIEFCEDLSVGGVTPSTELLRAVRGAVKIPVHSMVRPRGGDFCYSDEEFRRMKEEIRAAQSHGMNGIVLGILTEQSEIDGQRTGELVELAKPLPVTFHRAFDETPELFAALEAVIATGAARILTSGGAGDAVEGGDKLAKLVRTADRRIVVMPGGGIRPENLATVLDATRACEFHSGLSHLGRQRCLAQFEAAVANMKNILLAQAMAGARRPD